MAVATWQQVAEALGRPTSSFDSDKQGQITWWLNGVELLIKSRLGDVSQLDQADLVYVEVEAVAAKVPPPGSQGESSITVAVDDGSVTRRWESPVAASDITDTWWELLSPHAAEGAFTIRPAGAHCRALDAERWL